MTPWSGEVVGALLDGVTAGLYDLLRILIVITLVTGLVALAGFLIVRRRPTESADD
ncbi:MAG: hypothetical protein U9N56_06645 [Actinomycetota bacterium]|nr:hypothetical protein [Actinomycetota bacterium]